MANPETEDALTSSTQLVMMLARILGESLHSVDEVLEREAAGEISAATALDTLRAIVDKTYGEAGTAH